MTVHLQLWKYKYFKKNIRGELQIKATMCNHSSKKNVQVELRGAIVSEVWESTYYVENLVNC